MKSEREVFRTGGGAEDLAGYARAVRTGSWISVSGTAPASRGDVREQTLDAFRLALEAVEHFGGSVENVARTRIFLAAGCDWRGALVLWLRPWRSLALVVGGTIAFGFAVNAIATSAWPSGTHPMPNSGQSGLL
jgi:hypothetical protein